jgi:hypothetical protein
VRRILSALIASVSLVSFSGCVVIVTKKEARDTSGPAAKTAAKPTAAPVKTQMKK